MPNISWHSFDLRTGLRGMALVTQQRGSLSRIIGTSTDTTLNVSCWDGERARPRPGWDAATQPGTTMLVALDEDTEAIIWGGMTLRRESTSGEWVTCSLSTLEHYLDRRYTGNLGYFDTDQATIVAGLLGTLAVDGLDFSIDVPDSGSVLTRTYADDEDKTVLSALTEIRDVEGGLEFTMDLEWSDDDHLQIQRIFRARQRLGTSPAFPSSWTMPGCVTEFSYIEDYTQENGANDVMAVSSGEGDTRPQSDHAVAFDLLDAGWALFEQRYTPATSITSFEQLNAHAKARLAETQAGLSELSLTASLDQAPRLNMDWWLGDDIEVALTCPRFPEYVGPDGGLIPGFTTRQRVVGWEIDYDGRVLTPTTRAVA